jgi:hypothetical protein
MAFNSFLASCKSLRITTPFPAAKPSAFKTYGGDNVSKKAYPFSTVSEVKL